MSSAEIESGDNDPGIPDEVKKRILSLMQKMMEVGVCAVYGQEEEGIPDADVDCEANLESCSAGCCTLQFALTREEVKKGHLKHNPTRPFFIAHDPDGYCLHLNRDSLRCTVWHDRPMRCRRYDCKSTERIQDIC